MPANGGILTLGVGNVLASHPEQYRLEGREFTPNFTPIPNAFRICSNANGSPFDPNAPTALSDTSAGYGRSAETWQLYEMDYYIANL